MKARHPIQKTIFLSYRRKSSLWAALAIYKDLTRHRFDVFFDYDGIGSGNFEEIIIANIKAREHFLVLLTPSALNGIEKRTDWLRREIETAIKAKRNIVPLMFDGFDFRTPSIAKYLVGSLVSLKGYQALNVPPDFFDAAMARLRDKHLKTPPGVARVAVSRRAQRVTKTQQKRAETAPTVKPRQITAEQWFERGYSARSTSEELRCYNRALRLNPQYALAYYNRALVYESMGRLRAALTDYGRAIRLDPTDSDAHVNRALVRAERGDLLGALADLDIAVRLAPGDADAYFNRADVHLRKGQLGAALRDYSFAIRLAPKDADGYSNRGIAHEMNGDLALALRDYEMAVRLAPQDADVYYNRARLRAQQGDARRALADYGKVARLQPKHADAYYNRALLHADAGDYASAAADYKQYLRNGRDIGPRVRTAINRAIAALGGRPRNRRASTDDAVDSARGSRHGEQPRRRAGRTLSPTN